VSADEPTAPADPSQAPASIARAQATRRARTAAAVVAIASVIALAALAFAAAVVAIASVIALAALAFAARAGTTGFALPAPAAQPAHPPPQPPRRRRRRSLPHHRGRASSRSDSQPGHAIARRDPGRDGSRTDWPWSRSMVTICSVAQPRAAARCRSAYWRVVDSVLVSTWRMVDWRTYK